MDAMEAIRKTFFEECEEQLAEMEQGLTGMNEGSADAELVNSVFRAVHSIKGGAGAFKLDALVSFAHRFETVLDYIRSSRLEATPSTMRVMLRALDVLADLVRLSRSGDAIDDALWRPLAHELDDLISGGAAGVAAPVVEVRPEAAAPAPADFDLGFDFTPTAISFEPFQAEPAAPRTRTLRIKFKPHDALYTSANEPAVLIRELTKLGSARVVCHAEDVPQLEAMTTNASRLHWTITLDTDADTAAVREIFEFVDGTCDLVIEDPAIAGTADLSPPAEQSVAAAAPPVLRVEAAAKAAPSPASAGAAWDSSLPIATPAEADGAARDLTAVNAQQDGAAAANARRDGTTAAGASASATIRVDLDRVDRLINLVGELVINQAMLTQRVMADGIAKSSNAMIGLDELEQLTREIQESVMAIRAQPIKSLFQRMARVVREASDATGKSVRLKLDGEMTELDKTVIERLADPLTHMLRNAVDHGIEPAEARQAAGKNVEGVVRLSAAHRSGRVQIEISDDGGGINRKRVLEKAISKGLVAPGVELSDSEIDNLLFLPGFSTAESISNLSGRGVGMDVVRRSIQALGGRITISSQPGKGSTFVLSLPLTLAVLDGMVVSVAGETLVVPLTAIIETLRPTAESVHSLGGNAAVIKVRDRFVPLIDVGAELGFASRKSTGEDIGGVAILVEDETSATHALLVDSIEDQRQVVIKSIESNYGKIRGIAAATILGDGRVALILDVEDVVSISRSDAHSQVTELRAAGGVR